MGIFFALPQDISRQINLIVFAIQHILSKINLTSLLCLYPLQNLHHHLVPIHLYLHHLQTSLLRSISKIVHPNLIILNLLQLTTRYKSSLKLRGYLNIPASSATNRKRKEVEILKIFFDNLFHKSKMFSQLSRNKTILILPLETNLIKFILELLTTQHNEL